MPTAATLLAGVADLRGASLRDRLAEARKAVAATASPAALAEIDSIGVEAMRACIRSYVALLPTEAPARRTLADLPAAEAAGAARAAARPPAPMRRLPVPPRPADAADTDSGPAAAAPPAAVVDAVAAASDPGGAPQPAPALPPAPTPRPAPVAGPGRLANLRRPPAAEATEPEAPPELAAATVRNPLIPPGPVEGPMCDAAKLAAHRRKFGGSSWPYLRPDGVYDYSIPWLDPADDHIPF